MFILGIETSCDETAAGVLTVTRGKFIVRSNVVQSQIPIHRAYGGVVPEVAAREHVKNIIPVITAALKQAAVPLKKIDRIAVTRGPGLITALLVGIETAKALAWHQQIPIVGTNHLAGHVLVSQLDPHQPLTARDFPAVALIVSGGHTELILLRDAIHYQKIGATLDDAAGECFDKVGKLLQVGYPGGPAVSHSAATGRADKFQLPRPLL
ncbi:MAG: tRNA (adenosine(37)-N6)-threonylcarbamoyltransferase complex transferase subunit TsaD, partial [Patescibacteria group bacterium]